MVLALLLITLIITPIQFPTTLVSLEPPAQYQEAAQLLPSPSAVPASEVVLLSR